MIATWTYQEPRFEQLPVRQADFNTLAGVLSRADVGGFETETLINERCETVQRAVQTASQGRGPEDLVLLYFAGYGMRTGRGQWFLAASDTWPERLAATAVSAEQLGQELGRCRAGGTILVLDCAFAAGRSSHFDASEGEGPGLGDCLRGRGTQAILTGSDLVQYDEGEIPGESPAAPCLFTELIATGLQSGDADRDGDGRITAGELAEYALEGLRAAGSPQRPRTWFFDSGQERLVAIVPPRLRGPRLLDELRPLMESPSVAVRCAIIDELVVLLSMPEPSAARAARQALERLTQDDSRKVSERAKQALATPLAAGRKPPDAGATTLSAWPLPDPSATRPATAAGAPEHPRAAAEPTGRN